MPGGIYVRPAWRTADFRRNARKEKKLSAVQTEGLRQQGKDIWGNLGSGGSMR